MALDIFYDHITPAELTGYAREAIADRPENALVLSELLPDTPVNDLMYRFNRGTDAGLISAANFRSYDAEPTFGKRDGFMRITGELPAIGQQYVLDEYSQLRLRNADQEVRDVLLRDTVRIVRSIDVRMEFARADALVNGSVTIADNGVMATVNFGRKAEHSVTPAGALWSNTSTSVPIDDLQAWADIYVDTNGTLPGQIWTSTRVIRLLCRNAQFLSSVYPNGTVNVGTVRPNNVNDVLSDFGLPPLRAYDARAIDQLNVSRRYIADDKVLFLPPPGQKLGETTYGATLESQQPEYGLAGGQDLGGIVVGAFINKPTPIRVLTIGSAIGLPILGNPDLTLVADVA